MIHSIKKGDSMKEAASTDVRSDEKQVTEDSIPAKPAFQKPIIQDKGKKLMMCTWNQQEGHKSIQYTIPLGTC